MVVAASPAGLGESEHVQMIMALQQSPAGAKSQSYLSLAL